MWVNRILLGLVGRSAGLLLGSFGRFVLSVDRQAVGRYKYCGRTAGAMLFVKRCIIFSDVKHQNACFYVSSKKI